LKLRFLRVGVADRGINLRFGQIASGMQFGSIQFRDRLSGAQSVPFPRENLFYPSASARADMYFVYFDCSGDGVASLLAARQKDRQCDHSGCANPASKEFASPGCFGVVDFVWHDEH